VTTSRERGGRRASRRRAAFTADSVSIHAIKAGTPTDNLIAEIQSDSGSGLPSGTVLATGTLAGTCRADDGRFVRHGQGDDDEA
jgi:hypothetical protein